MNWHSTWRGTKNLPENEILGEETRLPRCWPHNARIPRQLFRPDRRARLHFFEPDVVVRTVYEMAYRLRKICEHCEQFPRGVQTLVLLAAGDCDGVTAVANGTIPQ